MQILREHYNNLLIAINELDNIRAIEPIAHYNPTIKDHIKLDEDFINAINCFNIYRCMVDIEGHLQYFFCKAMDKAIYYVSCTIDEENKVIDKVIFRLTTEGND